MNTTGNPFMYLNYYTRNIVNGGEGLYGHPVQKVWGVWQKSKPTATLKLFLQQILEYKFSTLQTFKGMTLFFKNVNCKGRSLKIQL